MEKSNCKTILRNYKWRWLCKRILQIYWRKYEFIVGWKLFKLSVF